MKNNLLTNMKGKTNFIAVILLSLLLVISSSLQVSAAGDGGGDDGGGGCPCGEIETCWDCWNYECCPLSGGKLCSCWKECCSTGCADCPEGTTTTRTTTTKRTTTPTTTSAGCGGFAIGANACQGSTCVTCTSSGWVSGSFPGCCGSTCCRTVNAYCSGTYCGGATPTTTPGTTPTTIWGGTTSTPTTTYTTTYTTVYTTSTTVDPCAGVTCADGWENVGNSYPCCDLTDPDNICTCQDQEYQDHYCSGGSCSPYTVTNTQTLRSGCHNCGYCKTCSDGTCIDKPGVKGTVTDAFFEPIKGAEVTILGLGLSDITDENGNYFICDFDSGTYDVIASKKGFEPVNKKLDFDGTSIVIDFDFVLYTAGSDCRQDCSKTTDEENLRCHADCDGINGCKFYDQRTKEVCTTPLNRVVGVTESYNSTHKLRCCVGEPYLYKKISGDRLVFPESKNIVRITRIVFWRGQFVRMIIDVFK